MRIPYFLNYLLLLFCSNWLINDQTFYLSIAGQKVHRYLVDAKREEGALASFLRLVMIL